MANFDEFKDRVRELGKQRREFVASKRTEQKSAMTEADAWRDRFNRAAEALFSEILNPRLSFVSAELEGVVYEATRDLHHGTLKFNQDERYAATVRLHFSIEPHEQSGLTLVSRPEIVPLLVTVGLERLGFPIEQIDNDAATQFIQEQIVRFLAMYESLADIPGYHIPSLVKDPVCGMEINRSEAVAKEAYYGRNFFFCVSDCHQRFVQDPERYARKA